MMIQGLGSKRAALVKELVSLQCEITDFAPTKRSMFRRCKRKCIALVVSRFGLLSVCRKHALVGLIFERKLDLDKTRRT